MADTDAVYTLTTPDGTITFNDVTFSDSGEDQLRITAIQGLDGASIRAPIDDMPFGHGGLWHNFWEGPRHIIIEGLMLIESVPPGDLQRPIRNGWTETLRTALRSIGALAVDTGTLVWEPEGESQCTLVVRHDVQFETDRADNNYTMTFHFGLVAEDPDWDGWSS